MSAEGDKLSATEIQKRVQTADNSGLTADDQPSLWDGRSCFNLRFRETRRTVSHTDGMMIGTEADMPGPEDRRVNWSVSQHCLLLGVAGSGMRALSTILHQAGHVVYGSDSIYGIGRAFRTGVSNDPAVTNVRLVPWDESSPDLRMDVCVCSSAVPASSPLLKCCLERSIPVMSLHTAVGSVFGERSQVCVAGTHGKSTTSGLLAWIVNSDAADAGVFIGAEFRSSFKSRFADKGGRYGRSNLAVIEACEFDRSFLRLHPQHVILNGIDGDHFDCFKDESAEDSAYRQFLERVPSDGTVFVNAECSRSKSVAAEAGVKTERWTLGDPVLSDWSGQVMRFSDGGMTVRIRNRGRKYGDFQVPLFGQHNAANLLAAVAMASCLGTSAVRCQRALTDFPGLRRRLECRGEYRGMQMLDDYAHHPTAVTAAIRSVRQEFPDNRIRVIFEPHQVRRLRRRWKQFIEALSLADEILVLPVFPAREKVSVADCHRIGRELAAIICDTGTPALFADGVKTAVTLIDSTGEPEDVFLTMGAGIVHRIHDEVHRKFQRDFAA